MSDSQVGFTADYAQSVPSDAWGFISEPVHWSASNWIEAGAVGAVGLTIYGFDTRIRTIAQDHRSSTTDRYAKAIRPFGQEYIAIPLVAAAAGSFVSDDPRLIRTALLGSESLALSMAGYAALQLMTNRVRPVNAHGKAEWSGPGLTHSHSFPSGEVTVAFSFATILADEWRDVPLVAPISYGIASAVAWERINDNAHWASDAFAGAVLGYVSSTWIEDRHPLQDTCFGSVHITPIITRQEQALELA